MTNANMDFLDQTVFQGVTIHNTMDQTVPCLALMSTVFHAIFRPGNVRSVSLAFKETHVNNRAVLVNMGYIVSRDAVRSVIRQEFVIH